MDEATLCNNVEGTAPPRHPRGFRYRTLPPAVILGLHLQYEKPARKRLDQVLADARNPILQG